LAICSISLPTRRPPRSTLAQALGTYEDAPQVFGYHGLEEASPLHNLDDRLQKIIEEEQVENSGLQLNTWIFLGS
jgi:hypothetical protein